MLLPTRVVGGCLDSRQMEPNPVAVNGDDTDTTDTTDATDATSVSAGIEAAAVAAAVSLPVSVQISASSNTCTEAGGGGGEGWWRPHHRPPPRLPPRPCHPHEGLDETLRDQGVRVGVAEPTLDLHAVRTAAEPPPNRTGPDRTGHAGKRTKGKSETRTRKGGQRMR